MIDYKDNSFIYYVSEIKYDCGYIKRYLESLSFCRKQNITALDETISKIDEIVYYVDTLIDGRCGDEPEDTEENKEEAN